MIRLSIIVLLLGSLVGVMAEGGKVGRRGTRVNEEELMPEFFDDGRNVMMLFVGLGIIVFSLLISLLIFKLRARSAAFENSLFQNLDE